MLCEFSESYEQMRWQLVRSTSGLGTLELTAGPDMREVLWSSVPTTCAV